MPPKLISIQDSAKRGALPTADLKIEGGSPAAFGSAIGEGLSQVGDAGQEAGNAVAYFQRAKQQEADQAAEFDRKAQFVEFGAAEDTRLAEEARNVSGPALDFTKSFMGTFDQRSQEFLANVPKAHQDEWRARFAQLRGSLSGAALKTEFDQRDAWSKTTTDDKLGKLENGITQSPDSIDAYRAQGEDLINSSLLSPQDKLERTTRWRAETALAYGLGKNQLDPEGNLKALGGVDPVSVHLPGSDATFATKTVKPSGQLADNIVAGLKNRGLTDAQARAGAAAAAAESGNDPNATNNAGGGQGAHGLFQWRGARLAELRKRYGPNPTGSQQLDFFVYELHGGDAGGKAVLAQTDEVAALHHIVHGFLRPSAAGAKGDMARGLSALGREVVAHGEATAARLRQPEPGKTYNQEDAIRELGMTADEAKTFVDTGKMPTAAQPSDTQAAGATTAPEVDPRYADLPLSARMQLIGAAQRQIEHRAQVADAQQQEDHAAKVNQLLLDIDDGKAGRADIAAARQAGWLSDYSDVNRAEGILDARDKANQDLNNFNAMLGAKDFVFNPFDDNQKKAVEAGVKAHGGTPQAAFQVWQRTGILAEAGSAAIRGALVSTDAHRVQGAASIASNMLEHNPNAFAGVQGGEDIEKSALLYRHQVADLGKTPDEAAQALATANTPAGKAKINANADAVKKFKTDISGAHPEAALGQSFGGWLRYFDPAFTAPEQVVAAKQDYADIAAQHFEQFGDPAAAKAYATEQMKKLYGVVDGRLMKYPPTHSYPAVNGSYDYIFKQAADDIKTATGHAVDPKNVYLVPLPTATGEAFRAGRPVPYSLHYMDEVDGQKVYRVLNGKAFTADPGPAKTQAQREHQRQFNQAREHTIDRPLPALGG